MAELGETGESLLGVELVLGVLMGHAVELLLVSLDMLDEVNEVAGLLELLKVLGINKVTELILNADHKLNGVEGVKTVVGEGAVKSNAGLLGGAEVIADDGENVLLDLILGRKHKGVLLVLSLLLPEGDLAGMLASLVAHSE